jgi:hypothetical protein
VATALWSARRAEGPDVVDAAVDALMAGLQSPTLDVLAGVPRRLAGIEVHDLLPAVCEELGVPFQVPESDAALEAAAAAMACQVLEGEIDAPTWTSWVHAAHGHNGAPPLDRVADLDDEYGLRAQFHDPAADLDAQARRIAGALADSFLARIEDPSGGPR